MHGMDVTIAKEQFRVKSNAVSLGIWVGRCTTCLLVTTSAATTYVGTRLEGCISYIALYSAAVKPCGLSMYTMTGA